MKKLSLACALFLFCQLVAAKEKQAQTESQKALNEVAQILSTGRASDGETYLAEVLRKDPSNTAARQVHAELLFQLNRFHFAADEAKEVLKTQPDDPESLLLLAKCYQSMHQPAKAVDFYEKFLLKPSFKTFSSGVFKDDPNATAEQYKTLVNVLKSQVQSESEKHAKSRTQVGNYLSAVAGSGYMRWKNPSAIKVYVKDGKGVEGYRPEFEESLRQAFDDWTESTGGKVAFVFLPDPTDAQMEVTWTSDLKAPALKAEAGLAKTSCGPDGLSKAEILLLTLDPFKEGPIGLNYLFNICLHEIGHALGLQGHSPHEEDIMSPSLYSQQGLSDRDINTIMALYSESSPQDNLPETDEWGRPLSAAVKCQRLVQSGTAAAMAGQYDKAIEKLEAALNMNPNNDLARKNLAVAANNLAIVPGTAADKELSLLRLALFWEPDNQAARGNLKSLLQSQGRDPQSFAARVLLADQCLSKNDLKGATVEYREALAIKEDPVIRNKLNGLKTGPAKSSK